MSTEKQKIGHYEMINSKNDTNSWDFSRPGSGDLLAQTMKTPKSPDQIDGTHANYTTLWKTIRDNIQSNSIIGIIKCRD